MKSHSKVTRLNFKQVDEMLFKNGMVNISQIQKRKFSYKYFLDNTLIHNMQPWPDQTIHNVENEVDLCVQQQYNQLLLFSITKNQKFNQIRNNIVKGVVKKLQLNDWVHPLKKMQDRIRNRINQFIKKIIKEINVNNKNKQDIVDQLQKFIAQDTFGVQQSKILNDQDEEKPQNDPNKLLIFDKPENEDTPTSPYGSTENSDEPVTIEPNNMNQQTIINLDSNKSIDQIRNDIVKIDISKTESSSQNQRILPEQKQNSSEENSFDCFNVQSFSMFKLRDEDSDL